MKSLLKFGTLFTLILSPTLASAQVSESEAVSACRTVITGKPGLTDFQFAEVKSDHSIGSWRITGLLNKGSDRKRFLCRVDDRGRVAVATVASAAPETPGEVR